MGSSQSVVRRTFDLSNVDQQELIVSLPAHITPPSPGDPTRRVPLAVRLRAALRVTGAIALAIGLVSGCDRLKAAVKGEKAVDPGDPVWRSDSTLLANKPEVLFRVIKHPKGTSVAPIAIIGAKGFRRLTMGNRGWRAFDLNYLQEGNTLDALRGGRVDGTIRMTRGMWVTDAQLDSIPKCPTLVPAGLAEVPSGVTLAVTGGRPRLNPVSSLSAGELNSAISRIPTLIAPSVGISTSMLSRYQREVHVMNTGIYSQPSILVSYNDPEVVSDTLSPLMQRPRQFIVILDKGVYGYRPSFTFTTLGNALTANRLTFLDYVDVDSDGKAELIFGAMRNKLFDLTVVLRFESEAWREVTSALVRCQVP